MQGKISRFVSVPLYSQLFPSCSNGVGRSGVFIALHILLERMQTEGSVDVFQTVKNLRIQRPAMVQTLVSCYTCSQHGGGIWLASSSG